MTVPIPPLTVAVFHSGPAWTKWSDAIKERLSKRGFRVQIRKEDRPDALCPGSDILIVHCDRGKLPGLAAQLEELWTKQWVAWYQVTQHTSGDGRPAGRRRSHANGYRPRN